MLKISTKELIICIITIMVLILAITTNVFASVPSVEGLGQNTNKEKDEFQQILDDKNTNSNSNKNTNTNTNTNRNANVNTNSNKNVNKNSTTIPDTGLDQSIVFIIAIFGVSAVYAYKKIRDYKNV